LWPASVPRTKTRRLVHGCRAAINSPAAGLARCDQIAGCDEINPVDGLRTRFLDIASPTTPPATSRSVHLSASNSTPHRQIKQQLKIALADEKKTNANLERDGF
jgi:hypothetical protein